MSSVVVKSIDKAVVKSTVDAYAARLLSSRPEVEEIVVFGSFENDTYAPGSDIDLFIVLSHSDRDIRDRIADLMPGAFPVGVDLFPYTRDEIARLGTSPVLEAVRRSGWRYTRASHAQ